MMESQFVSVGRRGVQKKDQDQSNEPFYLWVKKSLELDEPVVAFHRHPQNIPGEAKRILQSVRGNFYAC